MTMATRVTSRFPKITLLIALPIYCLLFPIPFCFLRDDTFYWTSVYKKFFKVCFVMVYVLYNRSIF